MFPSIFKDSNFDWLRFTDSTGVGMGRGLFISVSKQNSFNDHYAILFIKLDSCPYRTVSTLHHYTVK